MKTARLTIGIIDIVFASFCFVSAFFTWALKVALGLDFLNWVYEIFFVMLVTTGVIRLAFREKHIVKANIVNAVLHGCNLSFCIWLLEGEWVVLGIYPAVMLAFSLVEIVMNSKLGEKIAGIFKKN